MTANITSLIKAEKRRHRQKVKSVLRLLLNKINQKWSFSSEEEDEWDYRNAARIFHEATGCSLKSAIRYFYKIEDAAEWRSILGREPTVKDRIYYIGRYCDSAKELRRF